MTAKHPTREGWLLAACELLQTEFFKGEYQLPKKVACSCGFPRGTNKAIGQCWSPEVSSDGTTNLFICPTQAEPVRVLDILLHELGHAALGVEAKHGSKFRKWALSVGYLWHGYSTERSWFNVGLWPGYALDELHRRWAVLAEREGIDRFDIDRFDIDSEDNMEHRHRLEYEVVEWVLDDIVHGNRMHWWDPVRYEPSRDDD